MPNPPGWAFCVLEVGVAFHSPVGYSRVMHTTYVNNILATYARATLEEKLEGLNWYSDAHDLARELSSDDVWRAAGVIAALSPMKAWKTNVMLARNAFATGVVTGHTAGNNLIAQRILDGEHPHDVMGGDKTRAFTAAIATNGLTDFVTIDRHAHDVAVFMAYTDDTRKIGKRVYRDMSAAYTEAAKIVGISVCQMQAVTWVAWKRLKSEGKVPAILTEVAA